MLRDEVGQFRNVGQVEFLRYNTFLNGSNRFRALQRVVHLHNNHQLAADAKEKSSKRRLLLIMTSNFIREEFCLVSGLKFGVENLTDYNKAKDPIPFRRRVFSSDLDGRPIRGKDVGLLIESDVFKKLYDNDAGQLPVERLVPEETEARSRWFMEDLRRVPEANTTTIIADQHFGVSDIIGFQSYQGVPSASHTLANNSSFFNMATPSNLQTPNQSNWLSPSN
nr:hypothetical protein [Tanacetum cinerariifolium]